MLTEQEANKKDITLKFPGATADLIASKNLFDIYLKTKVLDVCGDALKENRWNDLYPFHLENLSLLNCHTKWENIYLIEEIIIWKERVYTDHSQDLLPRLPFNLFKILKWFS